MESMYRGSHRRRKLLAVSGVLVSGAMVLTACGSSGGGTSSSAPAATSAPTAATSAGANSTAGASSSGSAAKPAVVDGKINPGSLPALPANYQSQIPASCPAANKTKKLHLAFVSATTSQNPMQEMALGAKAAADQDGNVDLQEEAPSDVDESKEVTMLQSVTNTATDGIAWESVAPDLFTRALKNVQAKGIPLIAVDNKTPAGVTPNLLVANDDTQLGVELGEAFVAQNPDPNGTVVLGNDIPTLQLLVQRMNGVQQVIKQKLPNMKIVGPFDAKGNQALSVNEQAWQSAVNANPNAVGFIGVGGNDGISLPLIQKKTGKKFLAGSADVPPQALQGVKDGSLFALSSPEHWMKGYIAMYWLIQHARTCVPIPTGWWNSGSLLMTKKNIDAVLARQKNNATRLQYFVPKIEQELANPPLKAYDAQQ